MMVLVTTAHPQMLAHAHPRLGRLLVPDHYPRARATAEAGFVWAADNGAFSGLDESAFVGMLDAIAGLPGCRFVAVPDVVADAGATLDLWHRWLPRVSATGHPPALVAQDGLSSAGVPWSELGALFIGGSTAWKMSAEAARLAREAIGRGLWVHMGRVNSRRRYDYGRALGCHSCDGSSLSRWRSTRLRDALAWGDRPIQEALVV